MGPAKLGAPKRVSPIAVSPLSLPADTKSPKASPLPPKDWVTPGPKTVAREELVEAGASPGGTREGTSTSPLMGGTGEGADYGVLGGKGSGGGSWVTPPRLLNRDDILASLRHYYPDGERRSGKEGRVLVTIHIGMDGKVDSVDIAESAGEAFDSAARDVVQRMRFSPALGSQGPVPVKIRQEMDFRLTEE
jgi:protein TonB